jgi:ABC-type glycerol-3-phosphate transport system permease component
MEILNKKTHNRVFLIVIEIFILLIFLTLNIVPVIWGVLTSFKNPRDIAAFPPKIFNFVPVFEHYRTVIAGGLFRSMMVSVRNSAVTIILGALLASVTAFGFDRYRFRGRKILFFCVILGIPLAVGSSALLIPNYLYMVKIGLNNKIFTLPLLYITYNLPMAIWILKGNIEAIPISIDESARIEGCSDMYIFSHLILPLTKPALAAASLFLFIGSWNEFVTSSVMVDSPNLRPIQLSIYNYLGFFGREWGPLTASATIAIIPILIIFTFLSKLLISGLTQGSVKG